MMALSNNNNNNNNNNRLSHVQNVFISTEDNNGHDFKDPLGILPGITILTINIQSIGLMLGDSFLRTMKGMERLLISQSTLILGLAATDEGKRPDHGLLSASEDRVKVPGDTASTYVFGILLRAVFPVDFKYNLDYPFVDDVWVRNLHFVVTEKLGDRTDRMQECEADIVNRVFTVTSDEDCKVPQLPIVVAEERHSSCKQCRILRP
jgi:hypothetical protein